MTSHTVGQWVENGLKDD